MILRAVVVLAACSLGTLAVVGLLARVVPRLDDPRQLTSTPPRWWAEAVAASGTD